jgi:hypothetical protein
MPVIVGHCYPFGNKIFKIEPFESKLGWDSSNVKGGLIRNPKRLPSQDNILALDFNRKTKKCFFSYTRNFDGIQTKNSKIFTHPV